MTSRTREMTAGRPASLLLGFALPLMLGNVFQQLYTVVDTAIVGKALGVGALAALGATDWLNWMMLGIIQGLTQGFAILMAQEFGARRFERLRRAAAASRRWRFWRRRGNRSFWKLTRRWTRRPGGESGFTRAAATVKTRLCTSILRITGKTVAMR